jgi:hypothetical protein
MLTVPEVVEAMIRRSPYLEDALAQGIINVSSLARRMVPQVREEAMKTVREGAVIMAISRLASELRRRNEIRKGFFAAAPDLLVRSGLIEMTFAFSETLVRCQKDLLDRISSRRDYFVTFTHGVYEMTVIAGRDLDEPIRTAFKGERLLARIESLSAVTVKLPQGSTEVPGIYSYILKALAWVRINVVEVVSTLNELTLIIADADMDRAFAVLKRLA